MEELMAIAAPVRKKKGKERGAGEGKREREREKQRARESEREKEREREFTCDTFIVHDMWIMQKQKTIIVKYKRQVTSIRVYVVC